MTGTVFLEDSEISVGEANGIVYVPVVRTGDLSGPAVVNYGVTGNSATDGADFVGGNGSVTMAAGQDRVLVPVQILNDGLSEPTETIAFSIISVDSESTLLFPRTATIAILDDENPVVDPPAPPLSSPYAVTQQTLFSGVENPMRLEFSPHDPSIVFVPQKDGVLRVFDLDTGSYLPNFVDLRAEVNHAADRGLMDIAFHPDFANNPYLYAFYVVDPPESASRNGNAGLDGDGNRFAWVVRWTLDAATGYTTPVPGSKVVLVGGAGDSLSDISGGGTINSTDNISQAESGYNAQTGVYTDNYIKVDSLSHAGGALAFGPDGMLYIAVGDGTSYNTADPRSHSVQQLDSLSGKILRVDPLTGLGLADNPFVQAGDDLSSNHAKVYQLGLRNTYSMGFDSDGRLYMTNTGWNTWEEIESGPPGANFGWPYYEGGDNGVLAKTPSYQNLSTAPAFYAAVANGTIEITPSYRAFNHSDGAPGYEVQAIVGGDVVYSGSRYPAEFLNDYFFTDIVDGEVYVIDVNDRREVRYLYSSDGGAVHFTQGPDGYVYYANLFTGEIGRLLITEIDQLDLVARGSAFYDTDDDVYTLTNSTSQAGMVSSTDRIDVREDFNITFDAYLGAGDSGADGIAFVIHNDPLGYNVVGADGSGLGTMLIKNGIGIEFDTYNNPVSDKLAGQTDIAADHTAFFDTDSLTGTTPVALANIENNQWHSVVVHWDASAQTLSYTLDGVSMGTLTTDLISTFLGGSSFAYFGIGGGTGGLGNLQMVKLTSIAATYEGETPGNEAPVAIADSATTTPNTAVTVNVLANDSDPDLDPLGIVAVSTPAHGTAAISDNGTPADPTDDTVVYTPAAGYSGPDGFTYTISDGIASTVGSVSVTVSSVPPPNTPPVANPDSATTSTGAPVTISVLANDSDVDSNPITIVAVSTPAHGTATINNNGTPANPADDTIVYTSAAGYSGPDGFTYTISDGIASTVGSVSVTVSSVPPPNTPPVANPDSATTAAGTPVTVNVLANDSDVDSNPITIVAVSAPAHGTATINNNGTPANPADDTVVYTPTGGYSGPDGFTYTISDGTATTVGSVGVTVTAAPPATLTLKGNGSTTYDSGADVYTLTAGPGQAGTVMTTARVDVRQSFSVTFDVNLGDKDWGADGMTFVIHNAAAGANALGGAGSGMGIGGLANGLAIEFDTYNSPAGNRVIGAADIAADHTGFLDTDSLFGTTPFALPNIEDGLWHAVAVNWNAATHVLSYTFDGVAAGSLNTDMMSAFLGNSEFAYLGFGAGTGGLDNVQQVRVHSINATLEGQAPNTAPIANNDSATTAAGTPVSVNVLANDSDPNGDALTIVGVSTPGHGSAAINNNGTPANPADDFIVYTPAAGYAGPDNFTYTVSDGGEQRAATVNVTVTPPPPPVTLLAHGSTTFDSATGTFTLTSTTGQSGTVMTSARIDVREDFNVSFKLNLGDADWAADGMAFVIHNDPAGVNANGGAGSGLGVGGFQNGLAIEFDTYNSPAGNRVIGAADIAADHTGFLDTDSLFGTTPVALPNIEDGLWHSVVVNWDAATHILSYTFDGAAMGSLNTDMMSQFLGNSEYAYLGFGAGTGGLANVQMLQVIGLDATFV